MSYVSLVLPDGVLSDSNPLPIDLAKPTLIYAGQKVVTTAGTQVALAASQAVTGVTIKALHGNTGMIFVGDSAVDSGDFVLDAGEQIYVEIDNLASVWIDSSESGEGASYIAS